MFTTDMERQGMAQLRYQTHGERELIAISYDSLIEYQSAAKLEISDGQSLFSHMEEVFNSLNSPEALNLFPNLQVFRGVVTAGSFTYIPMGMWVMERSLGTQSVIGLRTSVLSRGGLASWCNLVSNFKCVNTTPNLPLEAFWDKITLFMQVPIKEIEKNLAKGQAA